MAVAGVENISAMDSSILMESRLPSSSSSGQTSNQGRRNSRPSFYLQMWRELENELSANRTGERVEDRLQIGTSDELNTGVSSSNLPHIQEDENIELEGSTEKETTNVSVSEDAMATGQEDHHSMTSEQSLDLGEVERERVKEIIRDWMNTGRNGVPSSGPSINISPRTQLLGQTEIERVRVAREWIQMACERRDISGGNLEEQAAEIGSQIERVRDGLGLDNNDFHTSKKRDIRILCGRQALIDLLNKNNEERKRELQGLQESCPVRNFAFRNRIQSVLRIQLMKNRGSADSNRNNAAAESELGFLRQQQTVTGLREGFLSRLQSNVSVQENDHSGSLHSNDCEVQTQGNSSAEVDNEHNEFDLSSKYGRSGPSSGCTENVSGSEVNIQGFEDQIEASLVHIVHGDNEEVVNDEVTLNTNPEDSESQNWQVISSESSGSGERERVVFEETVQALSDVGSEELQLQHHNSLSNRGRFEFEETVEHVQLEEAREAIHENQIHGDEDQDRHAILPDSFNLEAPGSEDAHRWDSSTHGDEQVSEDEAQEWSGGNLFREWTDGSQPELDQEEWQDGASDDTSVDNTQENEIRGQGQLVESFWHESGSHQTHVHWSPLTLDTGASSAERAAINYYSDDDNAHNIEIRELLSRRRVSSLLSSGFRESLNQLIQSYVERQSQTPDDWEPHENAPPAFAGHDGNLSNTNQNEDSSDVDAHTDILGSTSAVPSNRTWDQQFHDISWSRDMHHRPGTVLEMINDLRIEMARLEQRMNHMQGMLETCVDIQLELQRAVRQEVSAALNRTVNPSESDEAVISKSGSKWDLVRKGTCCICCDSKIDSLLYRCGHMCTCAKCAGLLLEGKGKCPMCLAPVVEVVRAYTLQ
ncbi:hypothetical protein V2J09_020936 [Rumex salicifolius]